MLPKIFQNINSLSVRLPKQGTPQCQASAARKTACRHHNSSQVGVSRQGNHMMQARKDEQNMPKWTRHARAHVHTHAYVRNQIYRYPPNQKGRVCLNGPAEVLSVVSHLSTKYLAPLPAQKSKCPDHHPCSPKPLPTHQEPNSNLH